MLKDFVQKNEINIKYVHHGENKVRFNKFQDLKDQDVEWLLSILRERRDAILNGAIEKRGNKLTPDGRKLLEDGHPILGKDAEGLGIID